MLVRSLCICKIFKSRRKQKWDFYIILFSSNKWLLQKIIINEIIEMLTITQDFYILFIVFDFADYLPHSLFSFIVSGGWKIYRLRLELFKKIYCFSCSTFHRLQIIFLFLDQSLDSINLIRIHKPPLSWSRFQKQSLLDKSFDYLMHCYTTHATLFTQLLNTHRSILQT